ncbi:unnamed protein product [Arctogadus glacialis]
MTAVSNWEGQSCQDKDANTHTHTYEQHMRLSYLSFITLAASARRRQHVDDERSAHAEPWAGVVLGCSVTRLHSLSFARDVWKQGLW